MIIINNWKMDASRCTLAHQGTGETLRLGEFHFLLLEILITHPDTVLSREFLIAEVWKNRVVGSNSLPTAIHALRLALGDDSKQKEIIQTIPKKGYFLNSEFITYAENESVSQPVSNDVERLTNDNKESEIAETNTIPVVPARALRNKRFSLRGSLGILLAIVVITATLGTLLWSTSPPQVNHPEGTQLKYVNFPDVTHLKIGYMYEPDTDATSSSAIEKNWHSIALNLDALLAENNASMKIYAYPSMNKLSLDLIITNRCHRNWQVMLTIRNWQQDGDKLNNIISKHTRRTLHEMPACE
ncbi:winged helix-turn-helix domain-containing protein [Citrobacter sp. OP27]